MGLFSEMIEARSSLMASAEARICFALKSFPEPDESIEVTKGLGWVLLSPAFLVDGLRILSFVCFCPAFGGCACEDNA